MEVKVGGGHNCNGCGERHFDTSKGFRRCYACDHDLCNKCALAMLQVVGINKNKHLLSASSPYNEVTINALLLMADEEQKVIDELQMKYFEAENGKYYYMID